MSLLADIIEMLVGMQFMWGMFLQLMCPMNVGLIKRIDSDIKLSKFHGVNAYLIDHFKYHLETF